ncbi:MAG: TetR/AcrR family transcriptional regulator, partial [Actinocatenispora sp.]
MASQSRTRLLTAGAEEFSRHGLRGTRVRDVVARAGVNERMLYEHFASKEGLYQAVLTEEGAGLAAAWAPVLDRAAALEPHAGMRLALRAFFDAVGVRPRLVALILHEGLGEGTVRMPIDLDEVPAPLRTLHERGRASGVFRSEGDVAVFYAAAVSLLTTLSSVPGRLAHLTGDSTPDARDRLRDQLVDLLLDGVTGP